MKKKLFFTSCMIMLVASITACGDSATASSSNSIEHSAENSSEAEALSSDDESEVISVENAIKSVCPSADVSASGSSLTIDLSPCYDSVETCVKSYSYDCARIIGTSGFETNYSDLSFFYKDDTLMVTLTVTDFANISDYATNLVCIPEKSGANYAVALAILYDKLFYNHKIENRQLIEQGKIADKYNVDGGDATITVQPEDELWFYSFFDKSIPFSFDDNTFAANYRYDRADKTQYGFDVWKDIDNAIDHLPLYFQKNPDCITSEKMVFICFDGNTDVRLAEFVNTKQSDGSFKMSANYFNDEFKEGVLAAYNQFSK